MKHVVKLLPAIAFFAFCTILSIRSSTQTPVEVLVSKPNTKKSHEFGTDCGSCHRKGGEAKTTFSASGSVLDEARAKVFKKAVIKLYTERKAKGDLVATLYTDELGNFYTNEAIDFSIGLYPSLYGTPTSAEPIKHMARPIFEGNCNSCHGPKEEKLGID